MLFYDSKNYQTNNINLDLEIRTNATGWVSEIVSISRYKRIYPFTYIDADISVTVTWA